MKIKNGIFFLTYDGYYNFTSGIGTQTKTFLKGIDAYHEKYADVYGDFEINLIVPEYDNSVYGYNEKDIEFANIIISRFGGKVYTCDSSLDKEGSDFWTVANWDKISTSASSIILKESKKYNKVIVITVDPPFLHVPKHLAINNKESLGIKSVILMYTSTYIHDEKILKDRLVWEQEGLLSAKDNCNIKIGDVCNYMREHLIKNYNINPESFVPYHSSLFLEDTDFYQMTQENILSVLIKNNIPLDKNIVFSFGRTSWVKGFDTLLESFALINCNTHLVLLVTPFVEGGVEEYETIIRDKNISCTLITEFTRELPIALSQYGKCKIVVCPSRREPFSNIPLEVGLWTKNNGAVVLASDIGGFPQQIIDNKNGFLFKVDNPDDLAQKILDILKLSDNELSNVRKEAYKKVINERDFYKNFGELLHSLWIS